jgi:hypothetical protein
MLVAGLVTPPLSWSPSMRVRTRVFGNPGPERGKMQFVLAGGGPRLTSGVATNFTLQSSMNGGVEKADG